MPEWNIVDSPSPGNQNQGFQAITAITPDDIWAVGSYVLFPASYRTLTAHWDGSAWGLVSSPNVGAEYSYLYGVDAASSNDVWAVGYYWDGPGHAYETLTLHWDGTQWSYIPSLNVGTGDNILYSVSAVSANEVWAVGRYKTPGNVWQTLVLRWNGTQWSHVPSPNAGTANNNYLFSVAAISATDVWAVGSADLPDVRSTLTLHWDGNAWTIVPSPNPGPAQRLNAVIALASNDVWAVGGWDTGNEEVRSLTLHWDGGEWRQVPSPSLSAYSNLKAAAALSANDIWAVGVYSHGQLSNFRTLTMHWDGVQWSHVPSPNVPATTHDVNGVAVVAHNSAWAVGSYIANSGTGLFKTLAMRYSDPCVTPTPTPTQPPGSCQVQFTDVPPDHTFYTYVRCLACRNILGGYADGTFRPGSDITRGQIAKIVSNAAEYEDDVSGLQTYADVPPDHTFWLWIERLSLHGDMSGYPCGGMGEPCDEESRPYFRPFNNATRGQLAKIVANAANVEGTPKGVFYTDVEGDNPFYLWIMRLTELSVMGGYDCGAEGEPCDEENRPYFRPYNNVTRGQASKIVANTFFPNCETP